MLLVYTKCLRRARLTRVWFDSGPPPFDKLRAGSWTSSGQAVRQAQHERNGMEHGRGGGGWARLGMCSVGRADVFSFGADVSSFRANVSTFGGNVFSEEGERSEGRAVRRMWRKARFAPSAGSGQVLRGRREDGQPGALGVGGAARGWAARAYYRRSQVPGCVQLRRSGRPKGPD